MNLAIRFPKPGEVIVPVETPFKISPPVSAPVSKVSEPVQKKIPQPDPVAGKPECTGYTKSRKRKITLAAVWVKPEVLPFRPEEGCNASSDEKAVEELLKIKSVKGVGEGANGSISLYTDSKENPFAVKMLKEKQSAFSKEKGDLLALELDHPALMKVYGAVVQDVRTGAYRAINKLDQVNDSDLCFTRLVAVVLEYIDGPNLFEALTGKKPLEGVGRGEGTAIATGINMVEGLIYLHRKGLSHCDLKTANIVVPPSRAVKLVDFSEMKKLDHKDTPYSFYGSYHLFPPEMIHKLQGKTPEISGIAADTWLLGLMLVRVTSGRLIGDFKADGSRDTTQDKEIANQRLMAYAHMGDAEKMIFLDKVMGQGMLPLKKLIIALTHHDPSQRLPLETARTVLRQMFADLSQC